MADYTITRDLKTGEFNVGTDSNTLQSVASIDTTSLDNQIDTLNDKYDAGTITAENYSEEMRETFDERSDIIENSTFADDGNHFYGQRLHINLGNEGHSLIIDQNALNTLAEINNDDLQSPQHVLSIDGTERLVIDADVVKGLDPDTFRSEGEVVGIDGGQVVITDTETYDMREADEWMNGEVFQFGDENGIKFVLNDVMANDVGVETLVIGDTEIDLGDRLRRYNELNTARIEVSEEEAKANGSYTEYGDGRFGITDMDAVEEQTAILVGIQEEIRAAVIETQNAPSIDKQHQIAPGLDISPG